MNSDVGEQPSEDEMRAAYEAELNRVTSVEMIVQTAVSLINIGGRRLGLAPPSPSGASEQSASAERDLEQVRDAIDGASALMPILERRMPAELGPLRDAIAQLKMAYAREAGASAAATSATSATSSTPTSASPSSGEPAKSSANPHEPSASPDKPAQDKDEQRPGPAQASGRLWVPGR